MKALIYAFYFSTFFLSAYSLQAGNRYWVASTPGNWNNTANWSTTSGGAGGASVPGASDNAIFNGAGLGNCTINATVNIISLSMAGYTGMISQGAFNVTINGNAGFAGTWVGGSGFMTVSGTFTLAGTAFTIPATLNVNGSSYTYSSGTLDATTNSSTVVFGSGMTITGTESLNNVTYNNTTPWSMTFTMPATTTLTIAGTMTIAGSSGIIFTNGNINLTGNLNLTNTGTGGGGTTVLNFTGTTGQSITSSISVNQACLPSVNINKPSGTLIFPAMINIGGSAWTYTTGTLDVTTNNSTVVFEATQTLTGSVTLNNVNFNNSTPWSMTFTIGAATTLTVNGSMTLSGVSAVILTGGTIDLAGNLSMTNTGTSGGGTTLLVFDGAGAQAITGSSATNECNLPSVNINKPSGTLTFPSMVSVGGSTWTYTAGTLDVTTNNATVCFASNITITGNHTLNNINFNNPTPWNTTFTIAATTTVTASGTVTLSGISSLIFSGGTIDLNGNLSLTNTGTSGGGSTVFAFTGAGAQAITGSLTLDQSSLPAVNINKPSGTLTFPSLLTMMGSSWTYTAGTLDVTTNNSTIVFGASNATTFTGSHTLNNVDFDNSTPWNNTYTFSAGTTLTVNGNMTMSGISDLIFSGGTIDLNGNLNLTNTGTSGGGSTVITFMSSANQAITSSLTIDQSSLPSVNIDKPSGTLTFPALLTMAGSNWTYTTGTMDVTTNNSTVVFGANNTTITGSHTLNNIDFDNETPWNNTYTVSAGTTLTASGNMTMSGISNLLFSGGTINLMGNLILTNTATGGGGSTVITFRSGTNQAIVSSLATVYQSSIPSVNINKPAGTLTFPALLSMVGSTWTYSAGTLDVTTNNSTVVFGANATTFWGNHTLNNITFDNSTPWANTYTLTGTTLTASGNMAISGGSSVTFTGGTIDVDGNLTLTNTNTNDGGSTLISFVSGANQSIISSLPVNQNSLPSIGINKTGGTLTFPTLLTVAGANWTYTAGTVDASTNASTVYFTGTINISSNGMSFYNVNVSKNTSTLGNNLSANNNITISGSGILSPGANTISLLGNWNDRSAAGFVKGTSTVGFNGSSLQTITNPAGETFSGLTVNNTGTGIQLENNVAVNTTLTMTQGNIDLNSNTITLGTSAASTGTLNYTLGNMINTGSFTRWFPKAVIAAGNAGLFPMGNTTDNRPFTVSAPTVAPTHGGTMTMTYFDASAITTVSFPDGAFTVQVIKDLTWTLSTGNLLAGGTYNLQISGSGYQTIGNVNDLRLTLPSSVVGTAGVNAGTTSIPIVNRTGLSFANLSNSFTIGSVNATMTTLPISLLSFTAAVSNGDVVLDWSASADLNTASYTVQRSPDGIAWNEVRQVDATDNTVNYSAVDNAPLTGETQYRIMITSKDGGTSYSQIRIVNLDAIMSGLSIYPNPVSNNLHIAFGHTGSYLVSLVNDIGQVLVSAHVDNADQFQLNVSTMRPGAYFVRVVGTGGEGGSELRTILINR